MSGDGRFIRPSPRITWAPRSPPERRGTNPDAPNYLADCCGVPAPASLRGDLFLVELCSDPRVGSAGAPGCQDAVDDRQRSSRANIRRAAAGIRAEIGGKQKGPGISGARVRQVKALSVPKTVTSAS